MTKEDLPQLVELQQFYNKFYGNGLIGLSDNYIQVDTESFKILSAGLEIKLQPRKEEEVELVCIVPMPNHDIKLCCLIWKEIKWTKVNCANQYHYH